MRYKQRTKSADAREWFVRKQRISRTIKQNEICHWMYESAREIKAEKNLTFSFAVTQTNKCIGIARCLERMHVYTTEKAKSQKQVFNFPFVMVIIIHIHACRSLFFQFQFHSFLIIWCIHYISSDAMFEVRNSIGNTIDFSFTPNIIFK